ncbi:MAG: mercuric reductase [Deltaproteobacteria bacterium]|nr:MAG: mercuric reductase [Deltaproteobacteria bacterium]
MNGFPNLTPVDDSDRVLLSRVRPEGWRNPEPEDRYTLVVIGGGTGGLVSAIGAASLGAKVALVERNLLGGDCLNYGCVPSKALIRAARWVKEAREVFRLAGGETGAVPTPFREAMRRVRGVRGEVSVHDSTEKVVSAGVHLFFDEARFTSDKTIRINGKDVEFKRAIIATGTSPRVPPIPGLQEAGYLTNETVFSLDRDPGSILVLGGGPIGCEMAQAFSRLGWEVTIVSRPDRLLPKEEEEASSLVEEAFRRDGIKVITRADAKEVSRKGEKKVVRWESPGGAGEGEFDEILVAAGRIPNVTGLNLEAAGIDYDPQKGIAVNDRLQTTNKRVFAVGDVAIPYRFTHTADATARIALKNALFFGREKVSSLVVPWCTYTDPEVAHARRVHSEGKDGDLTPLTIPLSEVDRAVTDGEEMGFLRVWHTPRGKIERVTLVSAEAGNIIGTFSLAMTAGLTLSDLSRTIFPYPTVGEVARKAGDGFMRGRLTPQVKKIFSAYFRFFPL